MVREGLRRTGYDEVALTSLSSADFSGIDGVVADLVNDQEGTGSVSVSLPSLRVDAFSVGIASEIQKVRRTGLDVRARGGLVAAAAGHQQADPRRRPLLRGRRRVLAGLAAGEALLPHRPADRDGRRHARHRRARQERRRHRPAATPSRRAARCRSAGSCRSRTRRSSGSARTASTSCAARSGCCATRSQGHAGAGEVARPGRDVRRGHREPRRPPHRTGDRAGLARRAARSRSGASTSRSTAGSTRCTPRGSTPTGTSPGTAPPTRCCPWDHIAAGLHDDFLWQDWQAALAEHGLPDCRWTPCYDCGVCTDYALEHVVASPVAARGRQPGHRPGPGRRGCGTGALPRTGSRGVGAVRGDAGFPVRLRYTKRGKVRWISHRDVARALERAFRITELPLAFTEGFSPRPKVSFGLALSTGHESDAEYLDLVFVRRGRSRRVAGAAHRRAPRGHRRHRRRPARGAGAGVARSVTAVVWRSSSTRRRGADHRVGVAVRASTSRSTRPQLPTDAAAQGPSRSRRTYGRSSASTSSSVNATAK